MAESSTRPLVLIADSHVQQGSEKEHEFFEMLSLIGSDDRYDVAFLGDNLDIWIASHSRYENEEHLHFLSWCREQKERRRVLFTEGNHEFYVVRHHADVFTECSETWLAYRQVLLLHGDMMHSSFSFHCLFRLFAKNGFGDWVMRWLPGGVSFAAQMKKILGTEGRKRIPDIPMKVVSRRIASICHAAMVSRAILGHFHRDIDRKLMDGVHFSILPAWKNDGEIGLLMPDGELTVMPWKKLLLTETECDGCTEKK